MALMFNGEQLQEVFMGTQTFLLLLLNSQKMKNERKKGTPGKPIQIIKKNSLIKLRVTGLQKKVIQRSSKLAGLSVSEFCRRSILNQHIYKPFSDEELKVYKDLSIYHLNFTRIRNYIQNKGATTEMLYEIDQVLKLIKSHLNKFKLQ